MLCALPNQNYSFTSHENIPTNGLFSPLFQTIDSPGRIVSEAITDTCVTAADSQWSKHSKGGEGGNLHDKPINNRMGAHGPQGFSVTHGKF